MDQLTRLSPEDAERTLIRVVQECQQWGDIAEGMAIPAEKKFIDRQYARAIAALAEIVEAGSDGDPLVEKPRRLLKQIIVPTNSTATMLPNRSAQRSMHG